METKLTDFTAEQLQIMLNAHECYRQDIKVGRCPHKSKEDLDLIRTQLLTAIGIVAMRENIASN